jgi:Uma2 family endonuclease
MAMGTTTSPMTFAEFERLPNNGKRYELRHGEVIEVPPPKHIHVALQARLLKLILMVLGDRGVVSLEVPFRPAPESEFWYADVAFVTRDRWGATDPNGNLEVAPELVIEVLSPSNTALEVSDREQTCLAAGAVEFWLVQPKFQTVRVSRLNGTFHTYTTAESIPLDGFGGGSIAVAAVFEPLDK